LPNFIACPLILVAEHQPAGAIMAKRRKKKSKAQKRGKLPRGNSAKRGKARKSLRAKATKRAVARAKPKGVTAKEAARKVQKMKKSAVETVVVEKTTPDAIIVTEGLDPAA
jgi:hypothetical protein